MAGCKCSGNGARPRSWSQFPPRFCVCGVRRGEAEKSHGLMGYLLNLINEFTGIVSARGRSQHNFYITSCVIYEATPEDGRLCQPRWDEQGFGSWWVTTPRPGTADGTALPAKPSGCTLPPLNNSLCIFKPETRAEGTEAWHTIQLSYMK